MKWLKDRTLVFKKKGNKKQFLFNDNVKDQIDAAEKHLDLLEPPSESQQVALQRVKDKLEKGLTLLAAGQKRIKLATSRIINQQEKVFIVYQIGWCYRY